MNDSHQLMDALRISLAEAHQAITLLTWENQELRDLLLEIRTAEPHGPNLTTWVLKNAGNPPMAHDVSEISALRRILLNHAATAEELALACRLLEQVRQRLLGQKALRPLESGK